MLAGLACPAGAQGFCYQTDGAERDSRRQRLVFAQMASLRGDAGAAAAPCETDRLCGGPGGRMLVAMMRHLGVMVVEASVTVNVGRKGQNMRA